tara:strand:+ start:133 stop:555 length:423 start_codon:yes stop_codon:yes gene_type:complete
MNKLIKMLKLHEGVRSKVYMCSAGYETIGVGRNIAESGLGLSDDEVEYLLANDISRVRQELTNEYEWFADLDDVRQDAMIDISFNLGQTRLRLFKNSLNAMRGGYYRAAAIEFMNSRWADQVGQRAITLTEMIRSGQYPQ